MQIDVRSRNVEVSQALRATVEEKVTRLSRFLEMEHAEVRLREEKNPRIAEREICEVVVDDGHGHVVRARAAGADVMTAIDRVIDKLAHRLEKTKGKLVGRSHPRRRVAPSVHSRLDLTTPREPLTSGPRTPIMRTIQPTTKPMTPDEALMQMEVMGTDVFLFTNVDSGTAAVLHRRPDGRIGMIEGT